MHVALNRRHVLSVAGCLAVLIVAVGTRLTTAADAPARPQFPPVAELKSQPDMPDLLLMFNGERVTTKEQWVKQRRPELKALFQHYMYGYAPAAPKITAKIAREDKQFFGGKATLKEITISYGPPECPKLNLLLIVPNGRTAPAPVFVGPNFQGNHTVVADPKVALPTVWMPERYAGVKDNRATDASRGAQVDVWAADTVIERGYALATFYCGDVDPDKHDFTDGVHPHFLPAGQQQLGPHDWGTIAAWAWGVSRAVDYLVTDQDVDAQRIAAVGHSRLGKTVLLAAALDERIALAIPHQAGCGGTAPSRGKVGESVQRINTAFPHWFNDTFPQFNEHVDLLPFDQHGLVALCAPRPVLFTNAVEDQWANPDGQFAVLQAAEPVYTFLAAGELAAQEPPGIDRLIDSQLGYFIRAGTHSMTRADWRVFLAYADKHLRAGAAKQAN